MLYQIDGGIVTLDNLILENYHNMPDDSKMHDDEILMLVKLEVGESMYSGHDEIKRIQ